MKRKLLSELLLKFYFRQPHSYHVPFGSYNQKNSIITSVEVLPIWKEQKFIAKLKAILTFKWKPKNEDLFKKADSVLREEVFGSAEDYGDILFDLNLLHHHRIWELNDLIAEDKLKIEGLQGGRILSAQKQGLHGTSELLNMKLALYNPLMCGLAMPENIWHTQGLKYQRLGAPATSPGCS